MKKTLALLIVLATAPLAAAADLYTPPITSTTGSVICKIANVSASTKTCAVELRDTNGVVLSASGSIPLPPGSIFALDTGFGTATEVYCYFKVGGGKNSVRASGTLAIQADPYAYNDAMVLPAQ